MSKEDSWLVCVRVEAECVDGSVRGNCEECDAEIWISPSSALLLTETNAKTVCIACAIAQTNAATERGERVELEPLRDEQLKEILQHVGGQKTPLAQRRTRLYDSTDDQNV